MIFQHAPTPMSAKTPRFRNEVQGHLSTVTYVDRKRMVISYAGAAFALWILATTLRADFWISVRTKKTKSEVQSQTSNNETARYVENRRTVISCVVAVVALPILVTTLRAHVLISVRTNKTKREVQSQILFTQSAMCVR